MSIKAILDNIEVHKDLKKSLPINEDTMGLVRSYDRTPRIPTGSLQLDYAIGGGYPIGRVTEIFGEEHTGKTTLCFLAISHLLAAKPDAKICYMDFESAVDLPYAEKWGFETTTVDLFRPKTYEMGMDYVYEAVKQNVYDLIVVDSIAASATIKEQNMKIGDSDVATRARINTQFCNKITQPLTISKTALILINQTRANLNPFSYVDYTLPGGKAIGFVKSLSLRTLRGKALALKNMIGFPLRLKIMKNKTHSFYADEIESAILLQQVTDDGIVDIYGTDMVGDAIIVGKKVGIFTKENGEVMGSTGKWHCQGQYLGNSADSVKDYLVNHPEFFETVLIPHLYEKMTQTVEPAPNPVVEEYLLEEDEAL